MLLGIKQVLLVGLLLSVGISYGGVSMNIPPIVQSSPVEESSRRSTTMSVEQGIIVRSVELLAREERNPPKGIAPRPDRDIGFATVFLRLENPHRERISLTICRIEIRNVFDHRVQLLSQPLQEMVLGSLENGKFPFYLTNKTGFVGDDRVEAAVTYQGGNKMQVVVSDPVEVIRH